MLHRSWLCPVPGTLVANASTGPAHQSGPLAVNMHAGRPSGYRHRNRKRFFYPLQYVVHPQSLAMDPGPSRLIPYPSTASPERCAPFKKKGACPRRGSLLRWQDTFAGDLPHGSPAHVRRPPTAIGRRQLPAHLVRPEWHGRRRPSPGGGVARARGVGRGAEVNKSQCVYYMKPIESKFRVFARRSTTTGAMTCSSLRPAVWGASPASHSQTSALW